MPRIRIENRSSAIARVSKKIFSDECIREPNNANAPSASAISVGIATAQAFTELCPVLNKTKMRAGIAMPPIAAMTGSAAFLGFLNSPSANSRFISKPTRKKKMDINPSLINT